MLFKSAAAAVVVVGNVAGASYAAAAGHIVISIGLSPVPPLTVYQSNIGRTLSVDIFGLLYVVVWLIFHCVVCVCCVYSYIGIQCAAAKIACANEWHGGGGGWSALANYPQIRCHFVFRYKMYIK